MLTEPQQLFVAALRSDEFKQGNNALLNAAGSEKRYCCLGVACEIYRRTTGNGVWENVVGNINYFRFAGMSISTVLHSAVAGWLGLFVNDPYIAVVNDESVTATKLNDDKGWTFNQIANAFEKYFEESNNAH